MIRIKPVIAMLHKLRDWQKISLCALLAMHFLLIIMSRPSQDDYGYLHSLQNSSIPEVIANFWNLWGGNVTMVFTSSVFIKLALVSEIWVAFALFGLVSSLIIGLAAFATFSLFNCFSQIEDRLFVSIVFALIGYSNLAFPAHLASLAFTTAAIAHLWPICFFLILCWMLTQKKRSGLFLLLCGALLGNANISEGAAILFITIILIISQSSKLNFNRIVLISELQSLKPLLIGEVFGIITIVVAPGFSSRVKVVSATDQGQFNIFRAFRSAFVAFSGSLITSPIFSLLLLTLGFLFISRKLNLIIFFGVISTQLFLLLFSFGLFFALTLGSTFAYASWHQSLGLILVASLFSIVIIENINKLNLISSRRIVETLLYSLLGALFLFDLFTGVMRGRSWDQAFEQNICSIKESYSSNLRGSELLNPISNLGFEDIETWPWMLQDYRAWLMASEEKYSCDSKLQSFSKNSRLSRSTTSLR
jgi:hypothetical protein